MEKQPILLKEVNTNNYNIYLGGRGVGTIIDNLKLNFWGIKIGSFCEIIIKDKIFILKCENSSPTRIGMYSVFKLYFIDDRKIAEFETSINFFDIIVSRAFINSDNKINYFQYLHYSKLSSEWVDENKVKIASLRNNNFFYNNTIIKEESEDLALLIILTVLIEKFVLKKLKRAFINYYLYVLLGVIVIIIGVVAYTLLGGK